MAHSPLETVSSFLDAEMLSVCIFQSSVCSLLIKIFFHDGIMGPTLITQLVGRLKNSNGFPFIKKERF